MTTTKKEILKKSGEPIKIEQTAKEFSLNSCDLLESAKDSEIEAALGENHLFETADLYAIIGNLMAKQSEGQEGALLNNGNWNFFYTASCVVHVNWNSDNRNWNVNTWHRGNGWDAGLRVFSPVN